MNLLHIAEKASRVSSCVKQNLLLLSQGCNGNIIHFQGKQEQQTYKRFQKQVVINREAIGLRSPAHTYVADRHR